MKRIAYLSYIRAAACLAIVLLHTVDVAVMLYKDKLTTGAINTSLGIVYCMMWAVPCFVMVTGALLLDKNRDITIKKTFSKYILRIVIALVAFSVIFALFDMLMNREPFGAGFLLTALKNAVAGEGWAHMWYLYLLIGLYLLMIFYKLIADHAKDKQYRYLLLIYFIFLSVLPLTGMLDLKIGFYIHVSTIYPFYLFAGHAVNSGKLRLPLILCIILAFAGIGGLIGSTILDSRSPVISKGNLLGYSSVFVILLSVAVFAAFSHLKDRGRGHITVSGDAGAGDVLKEDGRGVKEAGPGFIKRFVLEADRCSFGIYLIHMIFVRLVFRYWKLNPYATEPTILIFIGVTIAIFLVSFGITYIFKLIPGVKKIL